MSALPLWAALPVALLVVLGATLAVLGTWGLAVLPRFYERLHPPALASSWGTGAIVLAVIIATSAGEGRLAIEAIVVGVFVIVTTPVTMMVLTRAALQRDRAEGADVPPAAKADSVQSGSADPL
ncbi:MAG: cation:proton antiporter [Rubellimicrobium sp.]|nr:cation:proton antiporter [Rubellimicrobium sp.]